MTKKYKNYTPVFRTQCIDCSQTAFLRLKVYNVIEVSEETDEYLIKFDSGKAQWYASHRFMGVYNVKNA